MMKMVPSCVMPSQKILILVDAPTSKLRVALHMIDAAKASAQTLVSNKVKLAVIAGNRLDYVAGISAKLNTVFAAPWQIFMIQLSHGTKQYSRRRPSYLLLVVPGGSAEEVPTFIPALAKRAARSEKTRMRCLARECPLRSQIERDDLPEVDDPACELHGDDLEGGDAEDVVEGGDAEENDKDEADDEIVMPSGKHACIVDLWPFAQSRAFYKHIITALFGQSLPKHLILLTRTAHPAALLAAHDSQIAAHVVLGGVR